MATPDKNGAMHFGNTQFFFDGQYHAKPFLAFSELSVSTLYFFLLTFLPLLFL